MRFVSACAAGLLLVACASAQETLQNAGIVVKFPAAHRFLAMQMLPAAGRAADHVAGVLGLKVPRPVTVHIVNDSRALGVALREATGAEPPAWAAAVADPPRNQVFMRADLRGEPYDRMEGLLRHEFSHLALAAGRTASSAPMPRWLDEGIAQWVAGQARPEDVPDLRPRALFRRLPDILDSDEAFPAGEGAAAMAYAESYSFVGFLVERHGLDTPRRLVRGVLDGVRLDTVVDGVTGATLQDNWTAFTDTLRADKGWIASSAAEFAFAVFLVWATLRAIKRVRERRRLAHLRWEAEGDVAAVAEAAGEPPQQEVL